MARNCVASINLNAITNNYLYAKSLAPESRAIAVIKGNASEILTCCSYKGI